MIRHNEMTVAIIKFCTAVLLLYIVSLWLLRKYRNGGVALVSLCLPTLYVILDVLIKCRISPFSEACVWGKAFFPFSVGVAVLLVTPALYVLLTGATRLWKRLRSSL